MLTRINIDVSRSLVFLIFFVNFKSVPRKIVLVASIFLLLSEQYEYDTVCVMCRFFSELIRRAWCESNFYRLTSNRRDINKINHNVYHDYNNV